MQYSPLSCFLPLARLARKARRCSAARVLALSLFLPPVIARLGAQQPENLADADLQGQNLFQQSAATGMVLVVVRNHDVLIKGYGETFPGSDQRPDASSLLRLCSI